MELSELQKCTTMLSRATHQYPLVYVLLTSICSVSMRSQPEKVTSVAAQGDLPLTQLGSVRPVAPQPVTATPFRNPANATLSMPLTSPIWLLLFATYKLSRAKNSAEQRSLLSRKWLRGRWGFAGL